MDSRGLLWVFFAHVSDNKWFLKTKFIPAKLFFCTFQTKTNRKRVRKFDLFLCVLYLIVCAPSVYHRLHAPCRHEVSASWNSGSRTNLCQLKTWRRLIFEILIFSYGPVLKKMSFSCVLFFRKFQSFSWLSNNKNDKIFVK